MKNKKQQPITIQINTPNGIRANRILNTLSTKVSKRYSSTNNITNHFEMGFDGIWELVIRNKKKDSAIVLKGDDRYEAQQVFIYPKGFEVGEMHSYEAQIRNTELEAKVYSLISVISK